MYLGSGQTITITTYITKNNLQNHAKTSTHIHTHGEKKSMSSMNQSNTNGLEYKKKKFNVLVCVIYVVH